MPHGNRSQHTAGFMGDLTAVPDEWAIIKSAVIRDQRFEFEGFHRHKHQATNKELPTIDCQVPGRLGEEDVVHRKQSRIVC